MISVASKSSARDTRRLTASSNIWPIILGILTNSLVNCQGAQHGNLSMRSSLYHGDSFATALKLNFISYY